MHYEAKLSKYSDTIHHSAVLLALGVFCISPVSSIPLVYVVAEYAFDY